MEKAGVPERVNKRGSFLKSDFYMVTTPWWMRRLFPGCVWDVKTSEKVIYLTFDDGPHPEITPFVLSELKKYNASATFFCIGDNVRKFPETYRAVLAAGHAVGNHTMHHVNGWKTTETDYLNNAAAAAGYIESSLFRPPYGRITRGQLKKLRSGYNVVMWSVLAGDWDQRISPAACYERTRQKIYPGCIVVFHDSEKAQERLKYALPRLLEHFTSLGYRFKAIGNS